MSGTLISALAGLAVSISSLITWYIHTHTGTHSTTRKGDQ